MAESDEIPDRLVVSALEIAVGVAAAGTKLRPVPPFPAELKPYLKLQKLPPKVLGDVRRIVEADEGFRRRLAKVVPDDLLDEAGVLWLKRPEGWEQRLAELARVDETVDAAAALRRSERRREAAEQVARRAIAEHLALRLENEGLASTATSTASQLETLRRERDALVAQLQERTTEVRHLQDRLRASTDRLERARLDVTDAVRRAEEAERMRDDVLADRAQRLGSAVDEAVVLAGAASVAAALAQQAAAARLLSDALSSAVERLDCLEPRARPVSTASSTPTAPRARRRTASARRPIALPGGVYGSSLDAAEFLVRQPGVVVLVDGYNVAKLGWPNLTLEQQREQCIVAAEDVVRRYGTIVHVVFDGSEIEGAAASGRRLVRVQFSPPGVIADDVLRAEVAALPDETAVVAVSNDQALASDLRAAGANTIASEQWLAVAGR